MNQKMIVEMHNNNGGCIIMARYQCGLAPWKEWFDRGNPDEGQTLNAVH
jgi:hypothetical protein